MSSNYTDMIHSFSLSDSVSCDIFELIHCDIWGLYWEKSSCGSFYFLTLVDDFSRATWLYLLVDKSNVSSFFKKILYSY